MFKKISVALLVILVLAGCLFLVSYKSYNYKQSQTVEGYITDKIHIVSDYDATTDTKVEKYIFELRTYDQRNNILSITSLQVDEKTYNNYNIGDYYNYKNNN